MTRSEADSQESTFLPPCGDGLPYNAGLPGPQPFLPQACSWFTLLQAAEQSTALKENSFVR